LVRAPLVCVRGKLLGVSKREKERIGQRDTGDLKRVTKKE